MSREEIVAAIQKLCSDRFNGDYRAGFLYYSNNLETLSERQLEALLKDAGVGHLATRWVIAAEIVRELDSDGDGMISWDEFKSIL